MVRCSLVPVSDEWVSIHLPSPHVASLSLKRKLESYCSLYPDSISPYSFTPFPP